MGSLPSFREADDTDEWTANVRGGAARTRIRESREPQSCWKTKPRAPGSFHLFEEFREVHVGILECAFESITINFVVKRKHYPSSIRMFHLDVAAFAMNLKEAKTLQCRQYFSTREQWQLHSESSTTSCDSS